MRITLLVIAGVVFLLGVVAAKWLWRADMGIQQIEQSAPGEVAEISWDEVRGLLRRCEVTAAYLSHSGKAVLNLSSNRRVWTMEPEIGEFLQEEAKAREKCGPIIFATE